jgi:hypothetical protein
MTQNVTAAASIGQDAPDVEADVHALRAERDVLRAECDRLLLTMAWAARESNELAAIGEVARAVDGMDGEVEAALRRVGGTSAVAGFQHRPRDRGLPSLYDQSLAILADVAGRGVRDAGARARVDQFLNAHREDVALAQVRLRRAGDTGGPRPGALWLVKYQTRRPVDAGTAGGTDLFVLYVVTAGPGVVPDVPEAYHVITGSLWPAAAGVRSVSLVAEAYKFGAPADGGMFAGVGVYDQRTGRMSQAPAARQGAT